MAKSNSPNPSRQETHSRMIVELDTELYEAFKVACVVDDRTISSAVRKMMRDYVKQHQTKEPT